MWIWRHSNQVRGLLQVLLFIFQLSDHFFIQKSKKHTWPLKICRLPSVSAWRQLYSASIPQISKAQIHRRGRNRDVSFQPSKKPGRDSTRTEFMEAKLGGGRGWKEKWWRQRRGGWGGADERTDDADDDETKVAFLSSDKKEVYDGCSSSPRSKSCGLHPASQLLHILNTTNLIGNRCWEWEAQNGRGGGWEWKYVFKKNLKANKITFWLRQWRLTTKKCLLLYILIFVSMRALLLTLLLDLTSMSNWNYQRPH